MSPVLEERMLAAIGDAKTCPHGHPIDVGSRDRRACRWPTCEVGATVTILRFENEAEDLLHYLKDAGLEPGPGGHARRAPTTTRSSSTPTTATRARVTRSVAETVSVLADPSPPPRTALPEQLVLGARPLRPLGASARRSSER